MLGPTVLTGLHDTTSLHVCNTHTPVPYICFLSVAIKQSNSPSPHLQKNKNNKANPTYLKWQLHARFQPKVIFFYQLFL